MPITLVYRSPYKNLTGRHIVRFDDDSILAWFQRHWNEPPYDGDVSLSEKLFGQSVYGFEAFFESVGEHKLPVPQTDDQLGELLRSHCYAEGGMKYEPELFSVFTDDDELDLTYHFIDDRLIEREPQRFAFLTHEGSLPTSVDPDVNTDAEPHTFFFAHHPRSSADSQIWDQVVANATINDCAALLKEYSKDEPDGEHKYWEATDLRDFLIGNKEQQRSWQELLSDYIKQQSGIKEAEDQSQLLNSEHIIQLHHHADNFRRPVFYQVIIFDNVWAASHPDLASSLSRYATAGSP